MKQLTKERHEAICELRYAVSKKEPIKLKVIMKIIDKLFNRRYKEGGLVHDYVKELEERLFTLENQNSVYGFLGYKYEKVFFNVDTRLVKFSRELPGCKITTLKITSSKFKDVKIEIHQDELEKLIEQLKKGLE